MSYDSSTTTSAGLTSPRGKVLLIYTGGTIGMGCNPRTHALEPLDFNHLVDNLPEFKYLETGIDTYCFTPPVDSSDMSPQLWAELVKLISDRYDDYDGFVILHGTDTMAYTASALSFMLENLTKPVILTGSQLPIGQLRTDGKENLVTSIELASACHPDGRAIVPEVCIYFGGRLLRGNRATKQSADGFDAFATFNYPVLCHAGVNFVYHDHHILKPDYSRGMTPHTAMDTNVIVLSLFPGIQECFLRHVLEAPELRSIVMRTFGSGNAPHSPGLMQLLKEASLRGVTVGQHQPVCVGGGGDGALQHRSAVAGCRSGERIRWYGGERGDQIDASAGPLQRPPTHQGIHEPIALRGNKCIKLIVDH